MPIAKRSIEERIAQLDAQKKALQSKLGRQERAKDTRRKVLLGALLLHRIEHGGEQGERMQAWVKRELPGFLTRDTDKALFDDLLQAPGPQRDGQQRDTHDAPIELAALER